MQKYNLYCKKELIEKSHELLLSQVGIKEATGKNDGVNVKKYLNSVGLVEGYPYCVAGQYWCFDEGTKILNLPKTEIPIIRTGSVVKMYNSAKKTGELVLFKPAVHDLLVYIKPDGIYGHMERIIEVISDNKVITVAFNTSNGMSGSQRDGDGVFKRTRILNKKLGTMEVKGLIGFKFN